MRLDEALIEAAKRCARERYPRGWAGAAAMYTAEGSVLTSVYVEAPNEAASLCCETGAICEAHRRNEHVVATVCVGHEDERSPWEILAPCGLCIERLAWFGRDVECAVPDEGAPEAWAMRRLFELQPHRWDRWQRMPRGFPNAEQ